MQIINDRVHNKIWITFGIITANLHFFLRISRSLVRLRFFAWLISILIRLRYKLCIIGGSPRVIITIAYFRVCAWFTSSPQLQVSFFSFKFAFVPVSTFDSALFWIVKKVFFLKKRSLDPIEFLCKFLEIVSLSSQVYKKIRKPGPLKWKQNSQVRNLAMPIAHGER